MTYAVLSSQAPQKCIDKLRSIGFTPLLLPPFERLSPPVSTHADMLFFSYNDYIITHKEYRKVAKSVFEVLEGSCNIHIIESDDNVGANYPFDIAYNAIVINNTLFSYTNHTSGEILKFAGAQGISSSMVKQGYTACSTLKLSDSHVITADPSLAQKYRQYGIKVTQTSSGSIVLPPYDYGFIGGASGVFEDTVFFAGDIGKLADGNAVLKAISECAMNFVSLSEEMLCDIGGIKFFKA